MSGINIKSIFVPKYNIMAGHNQWKVEDSDYDFHQEIARSGYGDMLHDKDRNKKYESAITFTIQRLKKENPERPLHVLDIGTGTGLLSMMAARAGADLVTACEAFEPMSKCAESILKDNRIQNICVIAKRSTELVIGIDMPQKANVLVAELFDTELIGEAALETYKHAALYLLTDDAVLIPSAANLYLQIVESPFLWSHHRILPFNSIKKKLHLDDFQTPEIENCNGLPSVFDIQASQLQMVQYNHDLADKNICCLLEEPVLIKKFYFGPLANNIKLKDLLDIKSYSDGRKLRAIKSGTVHAFIVWWSLEMEPTNSISPISMAPTWINDLNSVWRDHWMQAIYFPKKSIFLNKNDYLTIRCNHDSLSMWFDVTSVSESQTMYQNDVKTQNLETNSLSFCVCGLHFAWSRTRISELNSSDYNVFSSNMLNYMDEAISSSTKLNVIIISDCSYLSYLVGQYFNDSSLQLSIYHVDTSPSSCSFLQSIYHSFNLKHNSNIQIYSSINEVINIFHVLNELPVNSTNSTSIVLAEPYGFSAVLPWDSLHFWYAVQQCYINTLNQSSLYLVAPSRLRIYAVLVEFENLWRIRYPVKSCEGFKLDHFDKLILDASAKVDATIEPHPLWEYPNVCKSYPEIVFDISLINNADYGTYFENAPNDLIKCNKSELVPLSSSVNGIVFWAEWLYEGNSSNKDWWYAPAGPIKPIVVDKFIEWKPHGTQQGVYLAPSDWKDVTTNQLNPIYINIDFNIHNGDISVFVKRNNQSF